MGESEGEIDTLPINPHNGDSDVIDQCMLTCECGLVKFEVVKSGLSITLGRLNFTGKPNSFVAIWENAVGAKLG